MGGLLLRYESALTKKGQDFVIWGGDDWNGLQCPLRQQGHQRMQVSEIVSTASGRLRPSPILGQNTKSL